MVINFDVRAIWQSTLGYYAIIKSTTATTVSIGCSHRQCQVCCRKQLVASAVDTAAGCWLSGRPTLSYPWKSVGHESVVMATTSWLTYWHQVRAVARTWKWKWQQLIPAPTPTSLLSLLPIYPLKKSRR